MKVKRQKQEKEGGKYPLLSLKAFVMKTIPIWSMVSDNTHVKIKIQYRTGIVLCKVRDINMYNCTQGDYDGSAQQTA